MQDPLDRFGEWFADAKAHLPENEYNAMTLATATKDGVPSARIVLLKGIDARGFVFYTNLESRKSQELKENPKAALCFHWIARGRQVRVEGRVEKVSDAEADAYFASRPQGARLGAIASKQSRPLDMRDTLVSSVKALEERYGENPPPRPEFWSGWRVAPERIEFWEEGKFRLHNREVYMRDRQGWRVEKLYP
jgi:pyridoxamine 5'-phosphate oxidase